MGELILPPGAGKKPGEITVEEAAICPRCNRPGKLVSNKRTRDERGKPCDVSVYQCDNEVCPWYNTGWPVQSDERGVVYQREQGPRGQDKDYPRMSPDAKFRGRALVEKIMEEEQRGDTKSE